MENTPNYNDSILDDADFTLVPAGGWTRFGNYIMDIVFYFIFRILFQTILIFTGVLKTGTRAVNEDGTRISTLTAFRRAISRIIPFEPLSALGSPPRPWHDTLTRTVVVDERLSRLPQQV